MATDLTERQLDSEELFQGKLLHAFRDRVRLPGGGESTREYVRHPGAVMIIPLLERAGGHPEVVLERQYRYPVGRTLIEFPAGKRDPGEDALTCAVRELREETGYRAREWARAGVLHPVVSYSTEVIEIWFARGLSAGARQLDEGEFLEVFSASAGELLDWCHTGRVTDAKTLVGAFWLHNVLSGAWMLDWRAPPADPPQP